MLSWWTLWWVLSLLSWWRVYFPSAELVDTLVGTFLAELVEGILSLLSWCDTLVGTFLAC